MYSELIHTRCRDGIDITKKGARISGGSTGGFKVYSCSPEILESGTVDIPLLDSLRQSKQSYSDPEFMDDAYLYLVPDHGAEFLMDFHPLHYDSSLQTGDYPHRPGNYINQIFIGDFADIYPYETFADPDIWDAQKKDEAYYYMNTPEPLPERDIGSSTGGRISVGDVAKFISEGRRELLKEALAFMLSQYGLPPEERKYLVILDIDSYCIELWIAAVELAFSRKMAARLPFATRLDRHVSANRYTVDLYGNYQTQINLQSKVQKQRWRAMIVGIDERDKANASGINVLANSPYVMLDGIRKTISSHFTAEHPYFECVTAYDKAHFDFTEGFLRSMDLNVPHPSVLDVYDMYMLLRKELPDESFDDPASLDVRELTRKGIRKATLEIMPGKVKTIVSLYAETNREDAFDLLLDEAAGSEAGSYRDFVLRTAAETYPEYTASESGLAELHQMLSKRQLEDGFIVFLTWKIRHLRTSEELRQYVRWMCSDLMQNMQSREVMCYQLGRRLDLMGGKKAYGDLTDYIMSGKLPDPEMKIYVRIANYSSGLGRILMSECVRQAAGRRKDTVCGILGTIAEEGMEELHVYLTKECVRAKHAVRALNQIALSMTTDEGSDFICGVIEEVKNAAKQDKEQSLLKRLFSSAEKES